MVKTSHLVYAVLLVICVGVLIAWFSAITPFFTASLPDSNGLRTLHLDGRDVHVSVADTPAEREQGLSGKLGLAPDEGMLFIFQQDGRYAFWMKNMFFSIDMVWLTADGQIIYIVSDAPPSSYPHAFTPPSPARYVLELPAGYTAAHGVHVGDTVQF